MDRSNKVYFDFTNIIGEILKSWIGDSLKEIKLILPTQAIRVTLITGDIYSIYIKKSGCGWDIGNYVLMDAKICLTLNLFKNFQVLGSKYCWNFPEFSFSKSLNLSSQFIFRTEILYGNLGKQLRDELLSI
jgi:hypothetical protein